MGFADKFAGLKKGLGSAKGNFGAKLSSTKENMSEKWHGTEDQPGMASKGKEWAKNYGQAFGATAGAVGAGAGAAGGFLKDNWTKVILIFAVIGIILIVVVWFYSVGGGQVTGGLGAVIGRGISGIFDSYAIRSFINTIKNPFGIGPESGEFETVQDTGQKTAPPNQAFSVEIRGATDTVMLDQEALTFIIKVNNLGSSKISKADVAIDLLAPYQGCLVFNEETYTELGGCKNKEAGALDCSCVCNTTTDCSCEGVDTSKPICPKTCSCTGAGAGAVTCQIYEIAPFSSKELVFTQGKIDGNCIVGRLGGSRLRPNIPVGNIYVSASAVTYYPTTSRLAVERIKEDYGVLLVKNDVLRQQETGAIYRSGTALTIDMDIGDQPIFDSVKKAGLLMRWQNLGSGKMPFNMKPFLFVITPKSFGQCLPLGFTQPYTLVGDGASAKFFIGTTPTVASVSELGWCELDGAAAVSTPLNNICPTGTYKSTDGTSCDSIVGCILCDDHLEDYWCRLDPDTNIVYGNIEKYAPHVKPIFDWVCGDEVLKSGNYHVCATTTLTEEFNVFTCNLDLPGSINTSENRITDYITAAAIYPYRVESSSLGIKTYCVETQTEICEANV